MQNFYTKIIKCLEKELNMEDKDSIIEELFETRGEDLHIAITKNEEYKKLWKKIEQTDSEIRKDTKHSKELLEAFEKYEDASCEMGYLTEKLMYKLGLQDGIKIIMEGTKHIDITKYLKERK